MICRDGNMYVDDLQFMMPKSVTINGHCYKPGTVLLLNYNDTPVFVEVLNIDVVNQAEYILSSVLITVDVDTHLDAFVTVSLTKSCCCHSVT